MKKPKIIELSPKIKKVKERETTGIKKLPEKIKKPPTEKQLASREKMRIARIEKLAILAKQKEIYLKENEISAKREALAEKKRLKRVENLKKIESSTPTVVKEEPVVKENEPLVVNPTNSIPFVKKVVVEPATVEIIKPDPTDYESPPKMKREEIRFYNYPIGRNCVIKPRFK